MKLVYTFSPNYYVIWSFLGLVGSKEDVRADGWICHVTTELD